MGLLEKWTAVVLATVNPLTGRAIAIPLGVQIGLPVIWVCVAAAMSNFALAAAIILLIDRLEHVPAIKRFIEKKRGKKLTRFIEGKGLFYAVTFGPLVLGTFTVILVFQALGTDRKRMLLYSLISAIILTPLIAWIATEYKDLLQALLHKMNYFG
jgi:ABC-type sugar transport system permease subunit